MFASQFHQHSVYKTRLHKNQQIYDTYIFKMQAKNTFLGQENESQANASERSV